MQPFAILPAAVTVMLLGMSPAQGAYPDVILGDNPSAYYRFEEAPGATTAMDSSVNGVDASYNYNVEGTSPLLGQPGIDTNSISFNGGGSDYGDVDIPSSQLITPLASDGVSGAPFSCELWVQPTGQPSSYSVPLEVAQYPKGWNIYVSGADANGGTSYFYLNMPNVLFQGFADFPIGFPSPWYHLVVTYNGASVMFYINGVAHGPYTVAYAPASSSDAHVGSGQGVGWLPFIGGVDEVAFYTNVLSASQIQTHYQIGTNSFRAVPTPPSVSATSGPNSTTNYSGLPVSFSVSPAGTLPMHYHWFENSTPVGSDSSTLSFNCQFATDNNASIQVIITNNYGSVTSAVAILTVLTNVNIPGTPNGIVRNVGSHAAFHVTAFGAAPITYQWTLSSDGGNTFTNLPGQTNDTLWLAKVQLSQDGNQYAVNVNWPFGSQSVSPATLNVQPRTEIVPLTGYGAIVAADNPVAYWRLDETTGSGTAVDAVGTFDGTYTPGTFGTITYGVTTGIPKTTDTAVGIANGATIQIPFAPELNPETTWSVESWVQPTSLGANGGDYRVVLSSEYNLYPNPYSGWYLYQQPNNTFAFVPQPANVFITAGPIVANNWYHVVITDDGVNFRFYLNGVLATAPYPSAGFIANGAGINQDGSAGIPTSTALGNTVLGQRTDGAFNTFEGTVDDTAIYNYALTPQQVYSHYIVATMLAINKSGTNVVLTWPVGTLQQATSLTGSFTNIPAAVSPYTNSVSGAKNFYRVHVP